MRACCFYDRRLLPGQGFEELAGAHLTRSGLAACSVERPGLSVSPLVHPPGFRLSGSAGYESRHVAASVAAALAGASAEHVTLDLSGVEHLDVATLADIAQAALRRPSGTRVRLTRVPPMLQRMLELFPELGAGMEVTRR
ncbi:STAS domain-containing protein [Streptomyces sp. MMG1121]|uniref:STAS domain-containing protein n=1 Tax=Streptomyces sp. MMG1121 TaxID=1415544 RepID=UPI000A88CA29|nr:STAS domain-containing protein [Streptomyces sp. MMG1121]